MVIDKAAKPIFDGLFAVFKKKMWPLIKKLLINLVLDVIKDAFDLIRKRLKEFFSKLENDKEDSVKHATRKAKAAEEKYKSEMNEAKKSKEQNEIEKHQRQANIAYGEAKAWKEIVETLKRERKALEEDINKFSSEVKAINKTSIKLSKAELENINIDDLVDMNDSQMKLSDDSNNNKTHIE